MQGSSGCFRSLRCASAARTNAEVTIVTLATPRFSSCALSWRLHDVHDPQSPMPLMTAVQSAASASIMPAGAALPASSFMSLTKRTSL